MKERSTLFLIRKTQVIATPKNHSSPILANLQNFDMALSYILYYVYTDVMISLPGICLTYGKISPCEVMNCRNISNNWQVGEKITYSWKT